MTQVLLRSFQCKAWVASTKPAVSLALTRHHLYSVPRLMYSQSLMHRGLQFSARVRKIIPQSNNVRLDGAIVPNAFHGRAGLSEAHEKLLTLADGGLDGANIPLQPLLVKARGIRAIIAHDATADKEDNFADGTAMIAESRRRASAVFSCGGPIDGRIGMLGCKRSLNSIGCILTAVAIQATRGRVRFFLVADLFMDAWGCWGQEIPEFHLVHPVAVAIQSLGSPKIRRIFGQVLGSSAIIIFPQYYLTWMLERSQPDFQRRRFSRCTGWAAILRNLHTWVRPIQVVIDCHLQARLQPIQIIQFRTDCGWLDKEVLYTIWINLQWLLAAVLVFSAHLEVDNIPLDINANPLKFIAKVCFRTSAPSFKISDLKIIWRLHRIAWTGKASAQWLQQQLADHNCEEHGCKLFATVFDMTYVNAGEILQQKRAQQQIGRI
ncbi:hypothetical protein B0H14DRAFT_3729304 [Mycena olivaceomarginata]|nr:hypothetical protein B0H14DRAFT_3729304 [Mycena olivaceomarginata]